MRLSFRWLIELSPTAAASKAAIAALRHFGQSNRAATIEDTIAL
jgi:hypothetical protein